MKKNTIAAEPAVKPPLDEGFIPAALWNRAYREAVRHSREPLVLGLEQSDHAVSVYRTDIAANGSAYSALNRRYIERIVKFLLWQRGGRRILVAGSPDIAEFIRREYSENGPRRFDSELIGRKVYGQPLAVEEAEERELMEIVSAMPLGRHLDGCRIGFDLGGSDRKCAALIDGKMVFSEEVRWDPYFEKDPSYHRDGVIDSLKRAAAKLPRVDAIGGSAAGIYVDNRVRVASLFRGIPEGDFEKRVAGMFIEIGKEWGVPFEVINDGEVTALAGSMAYGVNSLLGVAMGTSQAAGYVNKDGNVTTWLNELAFAPVDYSPNAPVDEWSGDAGCGAQYFSQQAVGRLCGPAGIELPEGMPLADKLLKVQELMISGDERALRIYETIGVYLGYSVAHYADFYDLENVMLLGRVMSGKGGEVIMSKAEEVLSREFPGIRRTLTFRLPDEQQKRHGQAMAAASLPVIGRK